MIRIGLVVTVWALVLYSLWRGYRRERRVDRFARLTWLIFVCIAAVYTLRNQPFARWVNDRLGDPLAAYCLSLFFILTGIVCYSASLRVLVSRKPVVYRARSYHLRLERASLPAALLLVFVMAAYLGDMATRDEAHHTLRLILDGYVLAQMGLVFIPVNHWMLRHEEVGPMRLKHLATLVLCGTFGASAFTSVLFIPPILLTGQPNAGLHLVPYGTISFVCLLVILAPHRWLVYAGLPWRWYRCARLRHLETRLRARVPFPAEPLRWRDLFHLSAVELMIYVAVINILDHYWELIPGDPWGESFFEQIDHIVKENPEYDHLMIALSRVK
jgi:hypothetical protein